MSGAYVASDFFVLRAPLLPLDDWLALSEGLEAHRCAIPAPPHALTGSLAASIDRDFTRVRAKLHEQFARPEVREAILLASPSLHASLPVWEAEPESKRGQRIEGALLRYVARMSGRATPFGLFAGHALGSWQPRSQLTLAELASHRRHTRLSHDCLCTIVGALLSIPELRSQIRYHPNSSLYRVGGRLRYAEARQVAAQLSYHLVAVDETRYLLAALERARTGARLDEIAESVRSDEVTRAEAAQFALELVAHQLLVPDLIPPVSGPEPLRYLLDRLAHLELGDAQPIAAALHALHDELSELDRTRLGAAPHLYQHLAEQLQRACPALTTPPQFQVELLPTPKILALSPAVRSELLRGAELVQRLAATAQNVPSLRQFAARFYDRYGDRELPLQEALDEDLGVSFEPPGARSADAAPLLAELRFPDPPREERFLRNARHDHLLQLLHRATWQRTHAVELTEEDLTILAPKETAVLHTSCAVMATLLADGEDALAADDFRLLLHGVTGPSGASLLGRFCHADPLLAEHVREFLRQEAALQPEALCAEIVHLPEGRLGSILLRPVFREYEIPFLSGSNVEADHQIPLADLRVSVQRGQVILRSERLGRTILPRQTTAHLVDHARDLTLYRFLCALSLQARGRAGPLWGPGLDAASFLPRLVCGRLILSPARWSLAQAQIQPLTAADRALRFAAMQRLRADLELPRLVALAEGDNLLPIDLDSPPSIDAALALLKNRSTARLVELFGGRADLCVHGPTGRFVHELIVPLLQKTAILSPTVSPSPPPSHVAAPPIPRTFAPGSEWLYGKLYTGMATADSLLPDLFKQVVAPCLKNGTVQSWFFIRYGDPEWHLRLRLHGAPERLLGDALPLLHTFAERHLTTRAIWKLQLDTYECEVERYGGPLGMRLAERIFHRDSEAAVSLLELLAGDEGADWRWRFTLLGADLLLSDLGFTLRDKRAVIHELRDRYRREFGADAAFLLSAGAFYRGQRSFLTALIDPHGRLPREIEAARTVLRERSRALAPACADFQRGAKDLSVSASSFAQSVIHMHANRMLRAALRAQELVIYECLARLYETALSTPAPEPEPA